MNDKKVTSLIEIENAKIMFRNFSGEPGKFNAKGCRNFCVVIPLEILPSVIEDGWNIRWLEAKEEGDENIPYLPVNVAFGDYPPNIWLITSKQKTRLTEETVSILDWAEIKNVDLILRPYNWEVNGKSGVKAYMKSIYVTIHENKFEMKYRDVPDSAQSSIMGGE